MTVLRIHLNRHGEVYNPAGILYGRLPGYGLSELGHAMAKRVAAYYLEGDFRVRALVRSPLLRATETIAPLAQASGLEPVVDERVIEAGNSFEGQKVTPGCLLEADNLVRLYNPMRPSWGEPYTSQVLRMRAAIASLRRRLENIAALERLDTVDGVIMSHQLPIWVSRLAAEGKPLYHDPRRRECALASVTTLSFEDGRFTNVNYHDICADIQPVKGVAGA